MYSLEYSLKQNAFHIDKLENTLKVNLENLINGKQSEYVIICISDDYEQLSEAVNLIRENLEINSEVDKVLKELNFR